MVWVFGQGEASHQDDFRQDYLCPITLTLRIRCPPFSVLTCVSSLDTGWRCARAEGFEDGG